MATSGSYLTSKVVNSMTGDGCPDRANISWSASWNPATLQWTVAWSANGAGYYNNNYVTIFSGTVTVKDQNGNVIQTKSMAGQIAQARKDVQLIADSFTVGVDTYGNQSLQFSAVFRIGYNSATGESTGSQTFALDQVPLASYFTYAPSGVTVGSSGGVSTVNITRYNSSYTHDVTWTFGSYSHTETGVGTSASWTIPATWLNAIPNSATGTCTVTLVTKSGSTQVGQAATAQFTITANVVPSYTSIVYSYRGPAYSAGITNALIAGYSQMRVAVSGAAGAYGSSVARMEFIKGTSTMATVNTSAASYTYDTPLLTAAETTTFTVRITDTRGKYVQQTSQSFTIKAYAMPSFTAASVYRSNSSGSPADDGTYIKITATAAATPAENSITSLQYATKETTSSSWSADANIPSGAVSGYSNTTSYDVRLTATDKLGNKAYKYYTIPTQAFTMDFKVGGKGVAFGKVAETDNLVDSAWQIRTSKATGDGLDAAIVVKSQNNAAIAAYNDTNANYIELCNGSSGRRGFYTLDKGWIFDLDTDDTFYIRLPVYEIKTTQRPTFGGGGRYPGVQFADFLNGEFGKKVVLEFADKGMNDHNKASRARWGVDVYSNDSSTNEILNYYEEYLLPRVETNLSENKAYSIITSKNFKTVNIGNITIGGNGYTSIASYKPSGTILCSWIHSIGTVSPTGAVFVQGNGDYILGAANASVTNLVIGYIVIGM